MEYRAVVMKKGKWWVGWLIDLPGVNAQERSRRKLLESLSIGAQDMLSLKVKPPPGAKIEKIAA